jgi:hypothetical protein
VSAASRGRLRALGAARTRRGGASSQRRTRARPLLLTTAASVLVIGIAALSAGEAWGAEMPAMHFGHRVRVATVCFRVTNPAGGQSTLYGLRYTDNPGRVDPATPAIVLVHGIASSTENWDFSRTWSVARALAAAGYVVYSAATRSPPRRTVPSCIRSSARSRAGPIPTAPAPTARPGNDRAGLAVAEWSSSAIAPVAGSSRGTPANITTSRP